MSESKLLLVLSNEKLLEGGSVLNADENNFIRKIKNKDSKGLEFVVDNYSNLIFKIIYNVLNSGFHSQYAEECANDVFLGVWDNIDSFDEEKGEFKHWIAAISKYKAIDYKRKLYKQSTDECIDDYPLPSEVSTEGLIISEENNEELFTAIDFLNEEDKEIFIRRYFLHEDIDNIAKEFGVNRNLVDKRLSRGRKFLKKKLLLLKGGAL